MTTYNAGWSRNNTDFGNLARCGEHNAEQIVFDCADVLETYPDASIVCIVRRSLDTEPYPATLAESGTSRILVLSNVETAKEGTITMELRAVSPDGTIYKSAYYKGRILMSLTGEGDTPGEPIADILNTLEARADAAQATAEEIQQKLDAGELNGKDGADGQDGADGTDGISPTVSISKADGVTTVTITDKDGTHTAEIADGAKGDTGAQGIQGIQGEKGEKGDTGAAGADGYSPTATVTKDGDTATITVTDKSGTTTAEVKDGSDASVTKENVVSALGYTPADIPHQFRLIQEITTENSLKSIKLTDLSLTEIYMLFKQPATGYAAYNCNVSLYTSNKISTSSGLYGWWSIAGSKTNQQSMGYVQIRGNLLDASYQQMDNYIMMQTNPRVLKYIVDAGTVFTGINISVDSTTFPDGTIVTIYGVDA